MHKNKWIYININSELALLVYMTFNNNYYKEQELGLNIKK